MTSRLPPFARFPHLPLRLAAIPLALVLFTASSPQVSSACGGAPLRQASSSPVLVELFTSQSCSSCPPADRLLGRLSSTGSSIIALAFHVDYWDYLGWKDPFSSEAWSARQRPYAEKLGSDSVYTPQIVVNGRRHGIGSDPSEVADLIAEATADRTEMKISLEIVTSTPDLLTVRLEAGPSHLLHGRRWLAQLAVLENQLETPVTGGENARRTLRNDRVVRRLVSAFLETSSRSPATVELTLPVDRTWRRNQLQLAAFLQDPETLWIHAATAIASPL